MSAMRRTITRLLLLFGALTVAACGGGSGATGSSDLAIPPNNIVATVTDAVGDARASAGMVWDISQVQTTLIEGPFRSEYLTLLVAVTFVQDVSVALPAPGQPLRGNPNGLGVEILLNVDGSDSTGTPESACSQTQSSPGIDALVDAGGFEGRLSDGAYPMLTDAGVVHDEAPVSVSAHTVTYTVNLAAWSAPATGIQKTKISVIAYNGAGQNGIETDCAPNSGPMSVSGN